MSPGFEIGFLYSTYMAGIVVFLYTSTDGLFITICLYISAQFENIQTEIKYLIERELGKYFIFSHCTYRYLSSAIRNNFLTKLHKWKQQKTFFVIFHQNLH